MAFRRIIKKKKIKKERKTSQVESYSSNGSSTHFRPEKNGSALSHIKDSSNEMSKKSLSYRLYSNKAEGLSRLVMWVPLFMGAWLVSGIILINISILTILILPLLFLTLVGKGSRATSIPFKKELDLVSLVFLLSCSLALYYWFSGAMIGVLLFVIGLMCFYLERTSSQTVMQAFSRAILISFVPALLSQAGVLSQLYGVSPDLLAGASSKDYEFYFGYLILGFVPGTILGGRELLLSYPIFKKANWTIEYPVSSRFSLRSSENKDNKDSNQLKRPGGFTRAVVVFLILGPAIPALTLPFQIFPETFLITSLAFFLIPKIAETIQNEPSKYPLLSIQLANLSALLAILMFVGALLAKYLI